MHHTRPHNYANIRVQSEQRKTFHKKTHNIAGQSLNFLKISCLMHVYFVTYTCVYTHYYMYCMESVEISFTVRTCSCVESIPHACQLWTLKRPNTEQTFPQREPLPCIFAAKKNTQD